MITILYINEQELWWGNYNPNLTPGNDGTGDGTWGKPFKTRKHALAQLEKNKLTGQVRNLHSQLIAFYPPI